MLHCCVRSTFVYTELFSGSEQFIIEIVFIAIPADVFITLFLPLTWIRASCRGSWAGWGAASQATQFKYVRKPDPTEDLVRRAYFSKSKKYVYVWRKQVKDRMGFEMRIKNSALNYVQQTEIET